MSLYVISGRSGSGKTVSLRLLEDLGYYCVDNLPVGMLPSLTTHINQEHEKIAVSVDARNMPEDTVSFQDLLRNVLHSQPPWKIIYLDADDEILLQRFSETRRKHPLTSNDTSLKEALCKEKNLLAPIASAADIGLDTSRLNTHELRKTLKDRLSFDQSDGIALMVMSFGYKHGVPTDADFVFDVRCLPNPYWHPGLRQFTGLDPAVEQFFEEKQDVKAMFSQLHDFLTGWIPHVIADNRRYLTIAIGCTGGVHRSVYLTERLARQLSAKYTQVQIRHRELTS